MEELKIQMNPLDTVAIKALINLFRIEQKGQENLERYIKGLKEAFKIMGYEYHNPIGESYSITRTDATPDRGSDEEGEIVECYTPMIRKYYEDGTSRIIKPAQVTVKNKKPVKKKQSKK